MTERSVSESHETDKSVDPPPDLTDCVLLRRYREGEADAATALYMRYAKRLQLLARAQAGRDLAIRIDPDDVVQSVFRTFFRRVAAGHYAIPDGEELWKLLLVIALNKVRELGVYHRAAKRDVGNTAPLVAALEQLTSQRTGTDESFAILRMTVDDILRDLSDIQRQMVLLRIEGHGIDHIAQVTERAKRSVERVLQAFRARLQAVLSVDNLGEMRPNP